MPLTQEQFEASLDKLFDPSVDTTDDNRVLESAHAFQNLVMHYIHVQAPVFKSLVMFDNLKVATMLKRFYRDTWGVYNCVQKLDSWEKSGEISKNARQKIQYEIGELGIRINTARPQEVRIAAAFSLWMATFRPIFLIKPPKAQKERAWRLDATINFWITTNYLSWYGDIKIGNPEVDAEDFRERIRRILYDFTYRAVNLSSLEFMYAFIFVRDKTLAEDQKAVAHTKYAEIRVPSAGGPTAA